MNFNFKNLSDFVEIRNSSKVRASNLQYLIIKSFFFKNIDKFQYRNQPNSWF